MKKAIIAGIMTLAMGVSLNAFAAGENPVVKYDNYTGKLNVTGEAADGSFVTFEILSLGSSYEDLKRVGCEDDIFYCSQTMADDGKYSFEIDIEGASGVYKAFVADAAKRERYEFEIPIVVPEEYVEAVDALNAAARVGYEQFADILDEKEFVLGYTIDVEAAGAAKENYYEYVKDNKINADEAAKNARIYKSFVLMEAAGSGRVDNIMDYIDELYINDKTLADELVYVVGVNSGAGEYMTEKLEGTAMTSLDELEDELETAYVLGIIKYSNGYGDIADAFERYGEKFGIKGSISTKACQKMNGNDYDKDEVGDAYKAFAGSGTGGTGGSGSSANRSPVSSSGPSAVMGSGTPDVKAEAWEKMIFTDLAESHWAAEAVSYLKNSGIISGTDTGAFEPDRPVTREEFAKLILLACGFEPEEGYSGFADVESGAWYDTYVYTAKLKGIVNGIGENLFGTGMNIIRQDMAAMTERAAEICGAELEKKREYISFSDESDISDYAAESVRHLYECGVINGKGENKFEPMGNATRAEAAKIIYEAFRGGIDK